MGPLDGVLVADFSRVLAGPYATMLLADLGATVVKVERPGSGDDTRSWGPPFAANGQTTYYQSVNRTKLSIALDLGDPQDRAIAHRLAAQADVFVENHKPGGLVRFGLDYLSVQALNPASVYCSISGFGADSDLPGYDLLVQAMGGLMSITGTTEPTKTGVAVVDVLTGLHATVGILAALHHRYATGAGQHVEVSLLGALLSSLVNQASAYVAAGVVAQPMGNAHPSIAPYEVFATADQPLVIAVGNDAQFATLCEVVDLDGAGYRTNGERVARRAELKIDLEERLATRTARQWQEALNGAGVPCGPINDISQAFALAAELGLDATVTIEGVPQVANPVKYSQTAVEYRNAPPGVDDDRVAVLALLERR